MSDHAHVYIYIYIYVPAAETMAMPITCSRIRKSCTGGVWNSWSRMASWKTMASHAFVRRGGNRIESGMRRSSIETAHGQGGQTGRKREKLTDLSKLVYTYIYIYIYINVTYLFVCFFLYVRVYLLSVGRSVCQSRHVVQYAKSGDPFVSIKVTVTYSRHQ